jgi:hypothetical protein
LLVDADGVDPEGSWGGFVPQIVEGDEEVGCYFESEPRDMDSERKNRGALGVREGFENRDVGCGELDVGECDADGVFEAAWK